MAVGFSNTNKPLNPRGLDASPKGYNRAALYSGKALDFDGTNDNVNLDGFTMSGNTATISFYLKADDWDANSFIFGAGTPEIVIGSTTGGNNLSFYDSSSWKTFGTISDTTSTNFFSIVFDGTTAIAYMNGVKFGDTLTITAIDLSSVTGVRLMSKYTGGVFFFNGQLSGFKIFNTALTAAQVSDLYNNPEKIVPTGVADTALKLWLPMMEGAGTTAYDGSGNGNHGTISGATYVNGVGAPVAQSAVIDWNKNKNDALYSEEFDNFNWTKTNGASVTANATTAPDGQNTADLISFSANFNSQVYNILSGNYSSQTHTVSVWAKVASGTENFRLKCTHAGIQDYYSNILTATTEWQRFDFSATFGSSAGTGILYAVINSTDAQARDIYFWGFQLETNTSTAGPYVRTGATAQTSPVLLPQGLTSGRDITGVNLFENVRKQGALNLDGNSWAEVHDNASLDFGTGNITIEAWAKAAYLNQGSGLNTILSLGGSSSGGNTMSLNIDSGLLPLTYYNSFYSVDATAQTNGSWFHILATYDGTNITLYINGVQVDQDAQTAADITNALVKQIGRDTNPNRLYQDQIAQPRIYNRALTASEVLRNYNSGKSTYQ